MLSELYRPKGWSDFVGQSVIGEIESACADPWNFKGTGLRWLFESDGIAGCGKTSAAYVALRALGCVDLDTTRLDSRAVTIADLRETERTMRTFGWGPMARRGYIIDEIQHLSKDCQRMLLGTLENLPEHVAVIGTTTSITWASEVDGLFSRWTRFRFRKPKAEDIAVMLELIADERGLPIPAGFDFLRYVQGRYVGAEDLCNNVRAAIDQLPGVLRRIEAAA